MDTDIFEGVRETCIDWLLTGETGMSSTYMCAVVLDRHIQLAYPCDPSDFHRCKLFLDRFTQYEKKQILEKIKKKNANNLWVNLINNWDVLEQIYERDLPKGESHELYVKLKALVQEKK